MSRCVQTFDWYCVLTYSTYINHSMLCAEHPMPICSINIHLWMHACVCNILTYTTSQRF